MACRAGCDGCCHAWLTVSAVEAHSIEVELHALSEEARARVAERGRRELGREASGEAPPRCAMLEDDGRCIVYAHRPLVCRTQGHALRYPAGLIPIAAVRGKAGTGDVIHCPLNFTHAAPQNVDVLDAERIDQILAVVNHRFALARGVSPETRTPLSALAAEADVLACRGLDDDGDARHDTDSKL